MIEQFSFPQFDATVIGAGLSGLFAAHKLNNELGLKVLGLEKGKSVGGTWYWNRYLGIQTDTDGFAYRYSFDKKVSPLWDKYARYQTGAQMRDYLEDIANRHNISSLFRFETGASEAIYDESRNLWQVKTTNGDIVTSRYLVSGTGVFSEPILPKIKDIDKFKGQIVHTARWPDSLKLDGLRVGILGTGSTGAQLIASASKVASQLTVFQRSAQYIVPAGQRDLTKDEVDNYCTNFEELWKEWRETRLACGFHEPLI